MFLINVLLFCFIWGDFFLYIFFVFIVKVLYDLDLDYLFILYGVIVVFCISFVVIGCFIVWLVLLGVF